MVLLFVVSPFALLLELKKIDKLKIQDRIFGVKLLDTNLQGGQVGSYQLQVEDMLVQIKGSVTSQEINELDIDSGIRIFRPAQAQKRALAMIADMNESMVTVAIANEMIVGYITFHRPEEDSRWSLEFPAGILELGAIEVSPHWRRHGIGAKMMEAAFAQDKLENYIVISTHYYWHWDLEGTGLSIWDYQKMLTKVMNVAGLSKTGTDEPDITTHPANMLQVRVGSRVSTKDKVKFELIRFRKKWS